MMSNGKMCKCLICRTATMKKNLYSCDNSSCPLYEMCKDCYDSHTMCHKMEEQNKDIDPKVVSLLNSINGEKVSRNGNSTGMF